MKKIAILTSGGDSAGINTCLTWLIKSCNYYKIVPYFVIGGYKGLVENDIIEATNDFLSPHYFNGGTAIYTSRFPEFKDRQYWQKAIDNLTSKDIDTLIILGGNGSFKGAEKISQNGIQVIGIPSTIDNNIKNTKYSIGFYNAVENVAMAIKNLRETAESHNRCYIIETMGDDCGELTKLAAVASNADIFSTPENFFTMDDIALKVKKFESKNKRSVIIVVTEKMYLDYDLLINKIQAITQYWTRLYSVSFLQRDGSPSALERYNDALIGCAAITFISLNKKISGIISLLGNQKFDLISFGDKGEKKASLYVDTKQLQKISEC